MFLLRFLSIFIVVCSPAIQEVLAADCAPADIRLHTQSDVDNFQANHGPGCDTVTGELYIGPEDLIDSPRDITNLDGLGELRAIHGGLVIEWNRMLADIDGLGNVTTIETGLNIKASNVLTSLEGLASLSHLSGFVWLDDLPELADLGPIVLDNDLITSFSIGYCGKITELGPLRNHTSIDFFLGLVGTGLENLDDLSNVSSFGGSVFIDYNPELTEIDGLASVTSVDRDLYITNNYALANIEGLAALESVGRNFYLSDSTSIEDIDGLENLSSIGGSLSLYYLSGITNLDALGGLTHVGGSIVIWGLNELSELQGFDSITSLDGGISIGQNGNLTSISGFNALEETGSSVYIYNNGDLETLNAFESLKHIGGSLEISRNQSLEHLNFLESLQTIAANFQLQSNESLTNLEGLSNISSIGASVEIIDNSLITNLDWLSGIEAIHGDLVIDANSDLANIDGFADLKTVGGNLRVMSSESLGDLTAFSKLERIDGSLTLDNNDLLASLHGLDNLVGFDGHLEITGHAALTDIATLNSVTSLDGLVISENSQLTNLYGMNGLRSIGGSLNIRDNPVLSDLSALSSLESIGQFLEIRNNGQLTNLNGLQGISHLGGGITISDNANLIGLTDLAGIRSLGEFIKSECAVLPSEENFNYPPCMGLEITGNTRLESLSGLDNILGVHGHFVIENNQSLSDCHPVVRLLDGFDNGRLGPGPGVTGLIPDVNGFVIVENNAASCGEIPLITTVTPEYCRPDSIDLWRPNDASEFQSRYRSDPEIPCTKIVGSLWVRPFRQERVDQLIELTFVGGDLTVGTSPDLADVSGLSNITYVGRNLYIHNTRRLANVSGLSGVREVGRDLRIFDNSVMTKIGGLSNLAYVGGDLQVRENGLLSDCQSLEKVLDGVDDGFQGPGVWPVPDVGGSTELYDNVDGCNSIEQVATLPSMASALVGSWYDPSRSGTGFMLHGVNDALAVGYYYGFDNSGDRFWLIGVHNGPITWQQPVSFDATYVTGGTFGDFDPGEIQENAWGQMELELPTCDEGSLTMTGTFAGSGAPQTLFNSVTRLVPTAGFECAGSYAMQPTDGLTGSWYDPSTAGQGFAVHKIDPLTGVVYFYGFDDAGKPLWLIGVWDGQIAFGSEIALQMNQVTGGTFEHVDPDQINEAPWGTLRIQFDTCTTAWAMLEGEDGTHEFDLQQLAGSEGIDCVDD